MSEENKTRYVLDLENGQQKYYDIPADKVAKFEARYPKAKRFNRMDVLGESSTLDSPSGTIALKQNANATDGQEMGNTDVYTTNDKADISNIDVNAEKKSKKQLPPFNPEALKDIPFEKISKEPLKEFKPQTLEEIQQDSLNKFKGEKSSPTDLVDVSQDLRENNQEKLHEDYYKHKFDRDYRQWSNDKQRLLSDLEVVADDNSKKELISEFEKIYGEGSFKEIEKDADVYIPKQAKEYLDKNKATVYETTQVPTGQIFGQTHTSITKNKEITTPYQQKMMETFLTQTEAGKKVVKEELDYIAELDTKVEDLKAEIEAKTAEAVAKKAEVEAKIQAEIQELKRSNKNLFVTKSKELEIRKKYQDELDATGYKDVFNDKMASVNIINEIEKLQKSYQERGLGAFESGWKEFTRRFPYVATNAATVGLMDFANMSSQRQALLSDDGKYEMSKKAFDLLNEQQAIKADQLTISQEIAQGTAQTIPFMAEFAFGGGVAKELGKGVAKVANKVGINNLITKIPNVITTNAVVKGASKGLGMTTSAAAKALVMPSTYRNAMESQFLDEDKSNYLDAFSHAWVVNTIANFAESVGDVLPTATLGKPGSFMNKVAKATSMQNFPTEFAEENIETALHAIFETGEGDWSDLTDARNQLVTAGTVLAIQSPYAVIGSSSAMAARANNYIQKRNINKAYQKNIVNMQNVFGDDAMDIRAAIDYIILEGNANGFDKTSDSLNAMMSNVISNSDITDDGKNSLYTYALSAMAKHTMDGATVQAANELLEANKEYIDQAVNQTTNNITTVKLNEAGKEYVVYKGDIILKEDGTIDNDNSSKSVFIKDSETGVVDVVSIDQVFEVVESISKDEAQKLLEEQTNAALEDKLANDSATIVEDLQTVEFNIDGQRAIGIVQSFNPSNGTYNILMNQGTMSVEIQPKDIIPHQIYGIETGDEVVYVQDGEFVIGTLDEDIQEQTFLDGLISVSGVEVPIENVIQKDKDGNISDVINQKGFVDPTVKDAVEQTEQAKTPIDGVDSDVSDPTVKEDIEPEIVVNEDGSYNFEQSEPQATVNTIEETLGKEQAQKFVEQNVLDAQARILGLKEPTPSIDFNTTKNNLNSYKANKEALESKLRYWQSVQNIIGKYEAKPMDDASKTKNKIKLNKNKSSLSMKPYEPKSFNLLDYSDEQLRDVADNSNDIGEIYDAYFTVLSKLSVENLKTWQQELLGLKIKRQSFIDYGDIAFVSKTIAQSWFGSKKDSVVYSIDQLANLLTEDYGYLVEPQDIIEFILDNPTNRIKKSNRLSKDLAIRFIEVMKEEYGQNVGGPDSQSGIQSYNIIKAIKDRIVENEKYGDIEKQLTPPESVILLFKDGVLNDINNFKEFEERIEQMNEDGDFKFPYSPEDYKSIKKYIEYAQKRIKLEDAIREYSEKASEYEDVENAIIFGEEVNSTEAVQNEIDELYAALEDESISDFEKYSIEDRINELSDSLKEQQDTSINDVIDEEAIIQEMNYTNEVDAINEKIAEAEAEVNQNPTEAQKEAGNYKKGHVTIQGLDISIENPKGSQRRGVDENGKAWSVDMKHSYGYIKGTVGVDGDHIDVVIGNNPTSEKVYVFDQIYENGDFDEHKVVIGANSAEEALETISSNYNDGKFRYSEQTETTIQDFKKWLDTSKKKTKAFAEYANNISKDKSSNDGVDTDIVNILTEYLYKYPKFVDRLRYVIGIEDKSERLAKFLDMIKNIEPLEDVKIRANEVNRLSNIYGKIIDEYEKKEKQRKINLEKGEKVLADLLTNALSAKIDDNFKQDLSIEEKESLLYNTFKEIQAPGYGPLHITMLINKEDLVNQIFDNAIKDSTDKNSNEYIDKKEGKIKKEVEESIASQIDQIDKEIASKESEYKSKLKKIGEAQADKQGTIFEDDKKTSDSLFDIETDISNNNVNAMILPIKDKIIALKKEKKALEASIPKKVKDALKAERDQLDIEISKQTKKTTKKALSKDFGKNNKIFTEESIEESLSILRKGLGNLNVGLNPEMMKAALKVSGYFLEGGARKFLEFSSGMIDKLGESIIPYLKQFYMAAKYDPNINPNWIKDMSTASEVDEMTNKQILEYYKSKTEVVEESILSDKEKLSLLESSTSSLIDDLLNDKTIFNSVKQAYDKLDQKDKTKLELARNAYNDVINNIASRVMRSVITDSTHPLLDFFKNDRKEIRAIIESKFEDMLNDSLVKSKELSDEQIKQMNIVSESILERVNDTPLLSMLLKDYIAKNDDNSKNAFKSEFQRMVQQELDESGMFPKTKDISNDVNLLSERYLNSQMDKAKQKLSTSESFPLEITHNEKDKPHEIANKAAAKNAKKILSDFAKKVIQSMPGYEIEVDKKGKPIYANESIAPIGGDVSFTVFREGSKHGVKVNFQLETVYGENSKFDSLKVNRLVLSNVEKIDGRTPKVTHNTFLDLDKFDPSINNIIRQIENLIPKENETVKPNGQISSGKQGSNDSSSVDGGSNANSTKQDVDNGPANNKGTDSISSKPSKQVVGNGKEEKLQPAGSTGDLFSNVDDGLSTRRGTSGRDNGRGTTNDNGTTSKSVKGNEPTNTRTNNTTTNKSADTKNKTDKKNVNNNRQTIEESVVPAGKMAKMEANISAIKLMKELVKSGKNATREEMAILRQYTGWGGLIDVFKKDHKLYKELKDILTDDEYNSIKQSTTTSFFTPPKVVKSIWDMLSKMGFKGGDILEPATGIGNMLSLMPNNISQNSNIRAIELDNISGNILKLLYPDAKVDIKGYQETNIKDNSIDAIVTNVPFGNMKLYDKQNKDISKKFSIQDFFFAKSIRALKPGGIGIFVASTSTMDSPSTSIREWINNNGADFIGAVRLNDSTFKKNAGTTVTSDIIIVRKRINGEVHESSKNKDFLDIKNVREIEFVNKDKNTEKATLDINQYFVNNPQNMAGEMMLGAENGSVNFRPTSQSLVETESINQDDVLKQFIESLPKNIFNANVKETSPNVQIVDENVKEGSLVVLNDKLFKIEFGEAVPLEVNKNKVAGREKVDVLKDYINLKNSINELIKAESSTESTDLEKLRKELNKSYDNFTKRYGPLYNNRKITFLKEDIDFPTLEAIENVEYNNDNSVKKISKSDIFYKRVINHQATPKAESLIDAMSISLHQEGLIDSSFIAELLNKSKNEVESEMLRKSLAFVDPETGNIIPKSDYLSGNVREKLKVAEEANDKAYDNNIKELIKVMPTDIPFSSISTTLGSTWIPTKVYDKFFKEVLDVDTSLKKTGRDTFITNLSRENNPVNKSYGVADTDITGSKLALDLMNNKQTIVRDKVDGKLVKNVEKTAQAALKQTEINLKFQSWLQSKNEYHEELQNIYNDQYNSFVEKTYDVSTFDRFSGVGGLLVQMPTVENKDGTSVMKFRPAKENTTEQNKSLEKMAKSNNISYKDGVYYTTDKDAANKFSKEANGDVKILRPHQKEGVLRALDGATMWAHQVGTGKTLTLITTAMEMKKNGLANKPLIVVQRSTIGQFVKEFKQQYPDAKILVPSAKDLKKSEREKLFAKIAYNDWDCVIMYHDYLNEIPDSPKRVNEYIEQLIADKIELLEELKNSKIEKTGAAINGLEKSIENLQSQKIDISDLSKEENVKDRSKAIDNTTAKGKALLDRRVSNTLFFEELGIDAILVDEAHSYKRLGFETNLNNIKGIDTSASKKTQSMKLKTSFILDKNDGKNVVFATGTPISNTMAEIWTFIRYLMPRKELERLGMKNFDAFVNNFGNVEDSAEFTTSGKFKMVKRFASYKNVPELIKIWKQIAHTVLTEEVSSLKAGVGTPFIEGGKPQDIMLEQTKELKAVMAGIKNALQDWEALSPKEKAMPENRAIPLLMYNYAARAAIDVRLVRSDLPDNPNSKLNRSVNDIIQDLKDSSSYNGTVAVFSDHLKSADGKFVLFNEMKNKLIEKGVPEDQIAIISDYKTDEQRLKLFAKINRGEVRVIMGSTEKLGVGVNIQNKLFALHHLDAPLRPSDYQQRNGRIIRQGNSHLTMGIPIRIRRYGVKGTLDVTGYQRLSIKEDFINQIMKGDILSRFIEEQDMEAGSNFDEMMASLSGSESALILTQKENELRKEESKYNQFKDSQKYYNQAIEKANNVLNTTSTVIGHIKEFMKSLDETFKDKELKSIEVGKLKGDTEESINETLKSINNSLAKQAEVVRESGVIGKSNMTIPIKVNDVPFKLKVEFNLNYQQRAGKMVNVVTKNVDLVSDIKVPDPYKRITEYTEIPLIDTSLGANVDSLPRIMNYILSMDFEKEAITKRENSIINADQVIKAYKPLLDNAYDNSKYLKLQKEVEELKERRDKEVKDLEELEEKERAEIEAIDASTFGKVEQEVEDFNISEYNEERDFVKSTSKKFNKLISTLRNTGLANNIFIDSFVPKSILDKNTSIVGKEDQILGYVDKDSNVHLIADKLNLNTPIHEFGHLWLNLLKDQDYNSYVQGLNLILENGKYLDKVNSNEAYNKLPFEERLNEALALAIGDKGEQAFKNSRNSLSSWISHLWRNIKSLFRMNDISNIQDITLDSFLDNATKELLSNKNIAERNASVNEIQFNTLDDVIDNTIGVKTPAYHRDALDRKLNKMIFKFNLNKLRENYQDRFLPVKNLYKYLRENGIDIPENQDYYIQATHVFGKIDNLLNNYDRNLHKPLINSINSIIADGTLTYRDIEDYMIVKHGIERNAYFANKALENGEEVRDDYSGIMGILEKKGLSAEDYVSEIESLIDKRKLDEMWTAVKAATFNSLLLSYQGGLINKATFEELNNRYENYIPLRGHDDETAQDKWDYSQMESNFNSPLKKALGRTSRAASPLAYIFNMNQSAINSSQKNLLNQTILRLAEKDKTGLMSVAKVWYEKVGEDDNGKAIYEIRTPEYNEDVDVRLENERAFEEKMKALESEDMAVKVGPNKVNIDKMFIKPYQAKEHEIVVYRNGVPNIIYFNGNPAVPKAINGTNVSNKADFLKPIAKITRNMASFFTTKNPKFVLTNASRDFIMASSALFIKEDFSYQKSFYKNLPISVKTIVSHIRGKAKQSDKYQKYLLEYLMNGASTGYSHMLEVNKLQKKIEKELETSKSKNGFSKYILDFLSKANDVAETYTRFAVYLSSREDGRSIIRSVSDAKEVTLNFNRRGAGGWGNNFFTSSYVFFNVGIQALDNFARLLKNNPKKSAIVMGAYMFSGAMSSIFNTVMGGLLGGGDDDDFEDEYFRLGDWERQNNFCIWTGDGFLKIPIAQEFRVFYAMGDNITQATLGKKDWLDALLDQLAAFSDLVPMNPAGAIEASSAELFPDIFKPGIQLAMNTKFTGAPIYNEWENKNKPGYQNIRTTRSGKPYVYEYMTDFSQMLNNMTGGDMVKKGSVSPNPDKVSHILNGYFGGLYTMLSQSFDAGYKTAKKIVDSSRDEVGVRVMDLPINSFYTSKDEMRLIGQSDLDRYYNIKNEVNRDLLYLKGYHEELDPRNRNNDSKDRLLLDEKIGNLEYNKDFLNIFLTRIKAVDRISKAMKNLNKDSQKEAEQDIADLQMEVVDLYNKIDELKDMTPKERKRNTKIGVKLHKYKID